MQAYGGDVLLQDLQSLFNDGWEYHPESGKAELARVCDVWKAKQLEEQGLSPGSEAAVLLQKLSRSLQSVVHRQPVVDGKSFALLRPQIEDAWQRQLRSQSASPAPKGQTPHTSVAEAHQNCECAPV